MEKNCFETMSDERVLERVEVLVARSNRLTAELLAHLAEVERRGLHHREACSSLFAFCVERLHMSEGAAGKRITAMRVARRFPVVFEMIAGGQIHLTAVNLLAAHLSAENHAELLARARHRSKREVEKLVAEIAPRPDVSSRVVALPRRANGPAQAEHAPARVDHATPRVVGAPAHVASARPAVVAPLSPRRYELRVTLDEEAHQALVGLQDLMAHQVPDRDPAVIVSRALALLLECTLARKVAVTERPRKAEPPGKRTRHIPAAVRRAVWLRDEGRCAYVDPKGRRCSATGSLQFHHLRNWARGAEHAPAEIELRCRAHNQYQAVLDYGANFMAARRRRPPSRAEEPPRPYVPAGCPFGRLEFRPVGALAGLVVVLAAVPASAQPAAGAPGPGWRAAVSAAIAFGHAEGQSAAWRATTFPCKPSRWRQRSTSSTVWRAPRATRTHGSSSTGSVPQRARRCRRSGPVARGSGSRARRRPAASPRSRATGRRCRSRGRRRR